MSVQTKYKHWMNDLLDLGNRNSLLNFKRDSKSVIQLLKPTAHELWKIIVSNEKTIKFPYVKDSSATIVRDIETNYSAKGTQDILLKLKSKARIISEEQDVNTMFLALGLLEWEGEQKQIKLTSPLLLVPVMLHQDSIRSPITMKMNEDEIVINPTLAYRLKVDYKAEMPIYEDEDYDKCIKKLQLFAEKHGWRILDEAYLSLFSFMKINMYKDLEANKDKLLHHPIVRGLAGDTSLFIAADSNKITVNSCSELDDLKPEEIYHVLDADSSQQDAILAAARDESFVLQGPPGTGKSQTITNIIASKLALGEKILFVSEKKTALDVVYKRLKDVGLGDFCLALHDVKASKRETLAQLEQSMLLSNKRIKISEGLSIELNKFEDCRTSLNSYTKQLNTKIEPLRKSIYYANGIIAQNESIPDLAFSIPFVENITEKQYERYVSAVLNYARALKDMSIIGNNPWKNTKITSVSNLFLNELKEKQAKYMPLILEIVESIENLKLKTQLSFYACYSEMNTNLKYLSIASSVLNLDESRKVTIGSISELKKLHDNQNNLINGYVENMEKSSIDIHSLLKISSFSDIIVLKAKIKEIKTVLKNNPAYKSLVKDAKRADFALENIAITEKYFQLEQEILKEYSKSIFSTKMLGKLKPLELRFKKKYSSASKYLNPSYHEDVKLIRGFLLDKSVKLEDSEMLHVIQKLLKFNEYKRAIDDQQSNMSYYFPEFYRKFETDFNAIRIIIEDFKSLNTSLSILEQIIDGIEKLNNKKISIDNLVCEALSNLDVDLSVLDNLAKNITGFKGDCPYSYIKRVCSDKDYAEYIAKTADTISDLLNKSKKGIDWFISLFVPSEELEHIELSKLYARMCQCFDNAGELEAWIDYNVQKHTLIDLDLEEFVSKVESCSLSHEDVFPAFEKRFYRLWIDAVMPRNREIQDFRISRLEERISDFAVLDRELFRINQTRIKAKLINSLPNLESFTTGEVNILKKEIGKQRRNMPIRKLFSRIPNLLPMLKPCMLMSPLTVSHYLESDSYTFDAVIFDEASQVKTENALGAIMRSKQAIIVGDSKQLPPTNFFEVQNEEIDYDEELGEESGESVLDDALFLPNRELLWHYRSRHESLIAFSNANIYSNHLVTFPSTIRKTRNCGVEFIYVEDGIYNGKKVPKGNSKEAEKIAELVFQHIEEFPNRTLGVISFGVVQQEAIEEAINIRRQECPECEYFFNEERHEAFFVKSLENVQGDERDTIIFSIGYARDAEGKMAMRFGPLSMMGGERRLNVAITRAKYNIKLVGSILPSDIDGNRVSQEGPKLLKKYIEYAKGDDVVKNDVAEEEFPEENYPFETMLYNFLVDSGYQVEKRVGCSDYRIDLAIRHPDIPEAYVLGIECDGESYSMNRTARERDRLRTEVLSLMGWTLYRVWALAWVRDTISEKQRLLKAIESAIKGYQKDESSDRVEEGSSFENDEAQDEYVFALEKDRNDYDILHQSFKPYVEFETEERYSESAIFNLLPLFEKIVALEQPVHRNIAAERMSKIIGVDKASMVSKNLVSKFALILGSKIKLKDDFLYYASMKDVKLRSAGCRTIFQISDDEIAKAMNLFQNNSIGIKKEELIRVTAKGFGFNRLTDKIEKRLESVIDNKKLL